MSGTATNGVDYSANSVTNRSDRLSVADANAGCPAYVTFGVGVTSVVVSLYPCTIPRLPRDGDHDLNVPGDAAAKRQLPGVVGRYTRCRHRPAES